MSGYNNFPGPGSSFKVGVVGNKADDTPDDHSSNQKIRNPLLHSSDGVQGEDLLFSSLMMPPSQFAQQSFPGGLDPGTLIYYLAQEGMNGGIILGFGNSKTKGGSGSQLGGTDLSGSSAVSELRSSKRNINVPPEIQETTERGVKVRKIKEKGEQHSLELLDGFPIHGALFDITGFRLPEISKVPTAKKKGQQMVTTDMMQQMLGQVMSMSGMIQGMLGRGGGGKTSNMGALGTIGQYGGASGVGYVDAYGNTLFFEANTKASSILAKNPNAIYSITTFAGGNVNNKIVVYNTANTAVSNTKLKAANVTQTINTANNAAKIAKNTSVSVANTANVKLNVSQGIGSAGWGNTGNNIYKNIIKGLDPHMAAAFKNLPYLVQGIDTSQGVSYVYNDIVHPQTVMKNAANLMSQVKTVEDMMAVIQRLQSDKSLYGQDKLSNVTFIVETAYGPAKKILDFTGNVTIQYSNTAKNNMSNLVKLMTNTSASFSLSSNKFVANTGQSNTVVRVSNNTINVPLTQSRPNSNNVVNTGGSTSGGGTGASSGGGGGAGTAGGGASGQNATNGNMFGKSSGILMQMMQRLASGGEKESMNMVQKFAGGDGQQLLQVLKQALNGGNPLNF
jgi:uncharacterized membrane protein YgcG